MLRCAWISVCYARRINSDYEGELCELRMSVLQNHNDAEL